MIIDKVLEERVARGVEWLDDNHPGWKGRVDVDELDMGDGYHCILSQVLRQKYGDVIDILGENFCLRHGFTLYNCPVGHSPNRYDQLTSIWKQQLIKTYDLAHDKVEPGAYKIVEIDDNGRENYDNFIVGEKVCVIKDPVGLLKDRYQFNLVVLSYKNNSLFIDCPIRVEKLTDSEGQK